MSIDGKIDKEVLETFNAQLGEALGEETTRGGQRGVGTQKSGPEKEGMPKGDLDNELKEDIESEEKDSIVGMEKDEEMNAKENKIWQDKDSKKKSVNRRKVKVQKEKNISVNIKDQENEIKDRSPAEIKRFF